MSDPGVSRGSTPGYLLASLQLAGAACLERSGRGLSGRIELIFSHGESLLPLAAEAALRLAQGHESDEWPAFAWALFVVMILAGTLFCGFARVGSNKAIKKWADSAGTHEGEVIIAILAAPVYWIGKLFQKSARRR